MRSSRLQTLLQQKQTYRRIVRMPETASPSPSSSPQPPPPPSTPPRMSPPFLAERLPASASSAAMTPHHAAPSVIRQLQAATYHRQLLPCELPPVREPSCSRPSSMYSRPLSTHIRQHCACNTRSHRLLPLPACFRPISGPAKTRQKDSPSLPETTRGVRQRCKRHSHRRHPNLRNQKKKNTNVVKKKEKKGKK